MKPIDTKVALLDAAEELVQLRGYHAFSYRDLAERVGIRSASIHHHFPRKPDLALELVRRYAEAFEAGLAQVRAEEVGALARVRGYAALYAGTFSRGGRWCLCASLAADAETLEEPVRLAVRDFFRAQEAWLTHTLEEGADLGQVRLPVPAAQAARGILSALEGALLSARAQSDPAAVEHVADWIAATLRP